MDDENAPVAAILEAAAIEQLSIRIVDATVDAIAVRFDIFDEFRIAWIGVVVDLEAALHIGIVDARFLIDVCDQHIVDEKNLVGSSRGRIFYLLDDFGL